MILFPANILRIREEGAGCLNTEIRENHRKSAAIGNFLGKKVIFLGKNFADIKLRLNFAPKYHSNMGHNTRKLSLNLNSTIMKKIFTLAFVALASLATISVSAQDRQEGATWAWEFGSTNVISATVGNTSDLTKVPLTFYLSNPDTAICAFETYIKGISPKLFVFDEDEQDFANARGSRLVSRHNIVMFDHTAKYGDEAFYISITGSGNPSFKGTEGDLVTVYFDATSLPEGPTTLELVDAFVVSNDKVASGSHTTSWYFSDAQKTAGLNKVVFTKANGKITGIADATAEDVANAKSIYTLNGTKVTTPQKGQIYVIDGKTVKY